MTGNKTKDDFQRSSSILCACSSGIVCVETTSSPPAAGGSSIPSQIGQFELRVRAPTLKGGLGKGLCTEEAVFLFATVRENLCNFCGYFRAPDQRHVKNK